MTQPTGFLEDGRPRYNRAAAARFREEQRALQQRLADATTLVERAALEAELERLREEFKQRKPPSRRSLW